MNHFKNRKKSSSIKSINFFRKLKVNQKRARILFKKVARLVKKSLRNVYLPIHQTRASVSLNFIELKKVLNFLSIIKMFENHSKIPNK